MCGRYRLKDPKRAFAWLEVVPQADFLPRFNIAPTQQVPVVNSAGSLEAMQWGMVPAWRGEPAKVLINARSETIREKRTFKKAFAQRRCLVPADGFYEWRRVDKRPYLFELAGQAPFAIGGIWEPGEDTSRCCLLLTTAANSLLASIHDRMPVIVRTEDRDEWLANGELGEVGFQRMTKPYSPEEMSAVAVSPIVNSAKVDDSRCSEPDRSAAKLAIARKEPANEDGRQTFLDLGIS